MKIKDITTNKKLLSVIIVILILLVMISVIFVPQTKYANLLLIISMEKKEYTINESIKVRVILKNNGFTTVKVADPDLDKFYLDFNFTLLDQQDNVYRRQPGIIGYAKMRILYPGEKIEKEIDLTENYTLNNNTFYNRITGRIYYTLPSYNHTGRYLIVAKYTKMGEANAGTTDNPKIVRVWKGEIVSNTLEFCIKP